MTSPFIKNPIGVHILKTGKKYDRWKVRIRWFQTVADWIAIPEWWQMCITEGDNIVWNYTKTHQPIQIGQEVWVVAGWYPSSLKQAEMFVPVDEDNPTVDGKEIFSEQRIFVDFDQRDNPKL